MLWPCLVNSTLRISGGNHSFWEPLPKKWAVGMGVPTYAIDDQTAIKVTEGTVEIVSEGHWKLFTPSP
jgi:hypothetical protein